jgi:hypothetical protein
MRVSSNGDTVGGNAARRAAIGAGVGGGMGMMHQRRVEQKHQQGVQQAGAQNQQTRDPATNTLFTRESYEAEVKKDPTKIVIVYKMPKEEVVK